MSARGLTRRRVTFRLCAGVALAAPALSSIACGACDEDSVASTYDHRVVEQAVRARDLVVYCRLEGSVEQQRLVAAVRAVAGVRKSSIRVSSSPPALSFAVDPALQTAASVVAATELRLPAGSHLRIVKIVGSALHPGGG